MKITIGQINPIPNDFQGNLKQILTGIDTAIADKSHMVVFPELSICGYGVEDLIYQDNFVERNIESINAIQLASKQYTGYIVVGHVNRNVTGYGKPFHNQLSIIKNGQIVASYNKRLLPYYDVFSENRWFEPGNSLCILPIEGKICSFLICEDCFYGDKSGEMYNHHVDPVSDSLDAGASTIISINSSPWIKGKSVDRLAMFKTISNARKVNILYVNQIGGHDSLVFDGNSTYYSYSDNKSITVSESTSYDYVSYNTLDTKSLDFVKSRLVTDDVNYEGRSGLRDMLIMGLRDYTRKSGFESIVLGSSGGIDSALAAAIACEAVGPENVHCIMMPSIFSSEGSVIDAKELHKKLGCKEYLVPITHSNFLNEINIGLGFAVWTGLGKAGIAPKYKEVVQYNKTADENIQARMRGQIVMHYSNAMGALAIGTGNKVETACGFSTVFGDSANCFNPLIDLYKTEIFYLSAMLSLPKSIINKTPSAELRPNQTDEASLLPYLVMDNIVYAYIEKNIGTHAKFIEFINKNDNIFQRDKDADVWYDWRTGRFPDQEAQYKRIIGLINRNEFKRRLAPMGIKVSAKSFGSGRRVPVVAKY